jgi:DNA-binding response OmpR family regulator
MKILLIDDATSITKMLSAYLELKRHDCTIANDGKTGLELIENSDFDVITLDIAMPGFSGFDVIDALHKNNNLDDKKIIVFTAVPLSGIQEYDLKQKGVHTILRKPLNLRTMLNTMEDIKNQ